MTSEQSAFTQRQVEDLWTHRFGPCAAMVESKLAPADWTCVQFHEAPGDFFEEVMMIANPSGEDGGETILNEWMTSVGKDPIIHATIFMSPDAYVRVMAQKERLDTLAATAAAKAPRAGLN